VAKKRGIDWWDNWDIGDGTIGQRYGATVKRWDLMNKTLIGLKNNPFSRNHIINLFQEKDLTETKGLDPCAYETLWSVRKLGGEMVLDLTLIQRSNDYLMAGYINKIQYVSLQMMVASHLGYKVGKFCHYVNNLHIYDRHIEAAKEIIGRDPLKIQPKIEILSNKDFYKFSIDDFKISNTELIQKIRSPLEIAI
jgi:thymidylate synthase